MVSTSQTPERSPAPPAAEPGAGQAARVLLFGVGGRTYGCAIEAVREIVPFRRCTRLPGAPLYVCGLINLRGTLVTVLDMAVRLGAQPARRTEGSIVLVEHGTKVAGVAVDQVRDVRSLAADAIESPGAEHTAAGIVLGVTRADGAVVVLLDVQAIVRHVLLH